MSRSRFRRPTKRWSPSKRSRSTAARPTRRVPRPTAPVRVGISRAPCSWPRPTAAGRARVRASSGSSSTGAWAQRVAVPTGYLAPIPDSLTTTAAATLPVAGLTALHTLYIGRAHRGKTGAGHRRGRRRRPVRRADGRAQRRRGDGGGRERIARRNGLRELGATHIVDRNAGRGRVRHHPRVGGRRVARAGAGDGRLRRFRRLVRVFVAASRRPSTFPPSTAATARGCAASSSSPSCNAPDPRCTIS